MPLCKNCGVLFITRNMLFVCLDSAMNGHLKANAVTLVTPLNGSTS